MKSYVYVTLVFLGWALYEGSGGADFVPERRAVVAEAPAAPMPAPAGPVDLPVLTAAVTPAPPQPIAPAPAADAPATEELAAVVEPTLESAIAEVLDEVVASGALEFQSLAAGPGLALAQTGPEIMEVAGPRVNMRTGPGTTYGIIATLDRGTQAELLEGGLDGWARIRVVDSGLVGYMAERLLTEAGT